MNRLFELFFEYGNFLLFILLQIISFYLIVNYNSQQGDIYFHSANNVAGLVLEKRSNFAKFVNLEIINDSLLQRNAKLQEELVAIRGYGNKIVVPESIKFSITVAEIINQTTHFRNNYITINKGKKDGIRRNTGAFSDNGVVGIVKEVSDDYSRIISLFNRELKLTAGVKNKHYFGNLYWNGEDRTSMTLEAIPKHANLAIGDTIITNGYSYIFPKGILIGTIEDFYIPPGGANYLITVKLFTDFSNLQYVYVLNNRNNTKIDSL